MAEVVKRIRIGVNVTGNLYRPKRTQSKPEKLPAVLYVCGHSGRGRDGNKTAFQHHGMWFATHGYVCLIIDTLQLGEVAGIHHGTYNHNRWWWHAAGYTPAGVECWAQIWRARRARTCSAKVAGLREEGRASAIPSRMVDRSRIETRSESKSCNTRWMPDTVISDGVRSLSSSACSRRRAYCRRPRARSR